MGDKVGLEDTLFPGIGLLRTAKSGFDDLSGVSAAKDAAKAQKKALAGQKLAEDAKLAEKDDEIARRRLRGGQRSSLIATTPRGVPSLGGA